MNVIEPLSLSKLPTGLLQNASTRLVSIVEPLEPNHPVIARQSSEIKSAAGMLVEIDRTPRASDVTGTINADDGDIDSLLPMIINNLESSIEMKQFNKEKGEAAETQLKLIDQRDRKALLHGGFVDQGKELTSLLADILDPSNDESRIASGIDQMVQLVNTKFESLQINLERRLNEGNLKSTTTEQKKILRYRMDRLLAYIDVNVVDNVEGFEAVKTPVNELITEIMGLYRAKVTRKENKNN